jgi:hypothetical protein
VHHVAQAGRGRAAPEHRRSTAPKSKPSPGTGRFHRHRAQTPALRRPGEMHRLRGLRAACRSACQTPSTGICPAARRSTSSTRRPSPTPCHRKTGRGACKDACPITNAQIISP